MSFVTNTPIDLNGYLQSSAMSLGIAVGTAGALHFIDKTFTGGLRALDGVVGRKINEAGKLVSNIKSTSEKIQSAMQTAMFQAAATVTTAALYELSRRVINQEDVKRQAHDIGQNIAYEQEDNLKKIYFSGKSQELINIISTITNNAAQNFNSNAVQFISGVGTNVVSYLTTGMPGASSIGGMFGTASDLGRAALRQFEALPEIKQKTLEAIKDLAAKCLSKLDLLKAEITTIFTTEAPQILKLLDTQGYTNANIVCSSLANLNTSTTINLAHPQTTYTNGLVSACDKITAKLQQFSTADFIKSFTELASDTVITIQKDIVKIFNQGVGLSVATYVQKLLDKPKTQNKESINDKSAALTLEEELARIKQLTETNEKLFNTDIGDNFKSPFQTDPASWFAPQAKTVTTTTPSTSSKPNTQSQTKSNNSPKAPSLTEEFLKPGFEQIGKSQFADWSGDFWQADKNSKSKPQINDQLISSGGQLTSKYLFGSRDILDYVSMYNAKVEIITTDAVDGKNLAWRVVRRLNADHTIKDEKTGINTEPTTYSEYNLPLLHVGFSNTDKGDLFGYFKSSMVVDGPSSSDPQSAYQRHSEVILDKGMNADAFLIQHGYNQEILTQARKNIDFSWNREVNENAKRYFEPTRNCWHYMHAVEQEYVRLGGVLYFKHIKK